MHRSALVQEVETMDFLDKINICEMKHYDNWSEALHAPMNHDSRISESGY
jgi:hypothetical protein